MLGHRSTPHRVSRRLLVPIVILSICATGAAVWAAIPGAQPGPHPDGTGTTPEGWHITPAGRQTPLGPGPLAVAASPNGDLVLVADAGYSSHALLVIDPSSGSVIQKIKAPGGKSVGGPWNISWGHSHGYYTGLAFSSDGSRAWASDGSGSSLHTYTISGQTVTEGARIRLTDNVGNARTRPASPSIRATPGCSWRATSTTLSTS